MCNDSVIHHSVGGGSNEISFEYGKSAECIDRSHIKLIGR